MANTTKTGQLSCMGCGAPIQAGFFCVKCEQGGAFDDAGSSKDKTPGSRFTGQAGRDKHKKLLAEDLARWGKRLSILTILGVGGWLIYANFGTQIETGVRKAMGWTKPQDRYDPTKDRAIVDPETGEELPGTQRRPLSQTQFGKEQSGR